MNGSTSHAPLPKTLIVVPALNEEAAIESVIRTLLADAPAAGTIGLVVADGGSTDRTRSIVAHLANQDPRVQLIDNPDRIQSAGINRAVERFGAGYDVLVRCDAHAEYPKGYVLQLLESLRTHQADAVVVPMDSIGDTCVRKAVAWASDTKIGSGGSAHRGGRKSGFVDHGHHAAFRMDSFVRAGGYDETFTHNEDAELDCRQRALGSRIYLDANIRLGYHPRASLGALWRQYESYGRGRSRTVRKHPGSLRLRQFAVPAHMLACILSVAVAPFAPWALAWPVAYLAALAGLSVWIAVVHASPCGLLGGAAALVMHASWALGFVKGLLMDSEHPWRVDTARPLKVNP